MCGIAGLVFEDKRWSAHAVDEMIEAIKHRGPNINHYYNHGPVVAGMCRLSINDLDGGHQPMFSEDCSIAVLYNGEIYNSEYLANFLKSKGVKLNSNCDGEVIAHLYERFGNSAFSMLDGMFSIFLWDNPNQKALLVRDFPGEKPLYYSKADSGGVAFASELGAFKKIKTQDMSINEQALWDIPTFLWVPEPLTVYNKIVAVKPGSVVEIHSNKVVVFDYISKAKFRRSHAHPNSAPPTVEEVYRVVEEAVESRLLSDVPIGTFLSGGLDSSIVSTIASKKLGKIDTFSIGFEDVIDPYHGMSDESQQAAETAKVIGSTHHEIRVSSNSFLADLDVMNASCGQPFAVSSGLGVLSVAKVANDAGVKVLLSGDGADECFGGYSWYPFLSTKHKYKPATQSPIDNTTMQSVFLPVEERIGLIKQLPIASQALAWHYYATEKEKASLFDRGFSEHRQSSCRLLEFLQNGDGAPEKFIENDRFFYFPNEMLTKVDRMTMAYSVEGRVPFASHSILELSSRLGFDEMVDRNGILKWMLREAFKKALPLDVVKRPKHGFNVPIDYWLKNKWSHLVEETFGPGSRLRKRGLLASNAREVAMRMLKDPRKLHGHTLFSFIMINRWLENEGH
jgi:asparagine synthase (glutamine-hydrolysing)